MNTLDLLCVTAIVLAFMAAAVVIFNLRQGAPRIVRMERANARPREELLEIFLSARGNALWEATLEVLDEAILAAGQEAIEAGEVRLVDRAVAKQTALLDLKEELLSCLEEAERRLELQGRVEAAGRRVQENG